MKGLELPVNMIIVIAIAVLVLVVVSAFFAGQTSSGINSIQLESAFSSACATWKNAYGCDDSARFTITTDFKFVGQTSGASLDNMCSHKTSGSYTGAADVPACKRLCGCPA